MNGDEPDRPAPRPHLLETLLARYVERHVLNGERPDPKVLAAGHPELVEPLQEMIRQYHALEQALMPPGTEVAHTEPMPTAPASLPQFPGFRTIERLGGGGAGEVFKLEDLSLGRVVAAKILRSDSALAGGFEAFLREARTLALFDDPRMVRVLEFRRSNPPVLLMEHVDGFELAAIGPSLEYTQRARVVAEIAEALDRAHALGLQHRDLKPTNVLLDAALRPKILDFGLAGSDPRRGHGAGTLAYMAPEQLDRTRPIDARTDIYALGVILYELLCGARPYEGKSDEEVIAAIRAGEPRLPVEIEPSVPEPLQAIALKAMERDPAERYATAREMGLDLRRFLDGRPVLARPSLYRSALERRLRPHLEQLREWERLHLIYPHEAQHLRAGYRRLVAREDDWIVQSRVLSFSQIALYLGAFLMLCGSLLYSSVYLTSDDASAREPVRALLALGLPLAALNAFAERLFRREHKAAAVAFYLGAAVLLPPLLLILLRESGLLAASPDKGLELFERISNRQLQVASLVSCGWVAYLAVRTRTVALSSALTVLAAVTNVTLLADRGLKRWLEEGRWDVLAVHLVPLLVLLAVSARWLETRQLFWFAEPLYMGATSLYVLVLEMLALDGRAFAHLGLTLAPFQDPKVSDPTLLDTVTAMTVNGLLVYSLGAVLERRGSPLMKTPSWLLISLSPFAMLEPLAFLVKTGEYSRRFDWTYLALALTVTVLSRFRQRRSFYFAGLVNSALALWLITDHYQWFDRAGWAIVVVVSGLLALVAGFGLDVGERNRRSDTRDSLP